VRAGAILRLAAGALLVAACGGPTPASPTVDPLAGNYRGLGGGGAMAQVQALTKRFSELHPGVIWDLTDVGSDSSVALTKKGEADFGFISRDLKPGEAGAVQLLSIGAVGTAVVVNSKNSVVGLTKEQIRDIFSGKITNWSTVGGPAAPIKVIIREANAATRANFEAYFFDGKPNYSKDAIEIFEIEETLKAIYSFKDAIGMATVTARTLGDPQIRLLAIDGVPATRETLISGQYKIRRPLYLISSVDPTAVKPGIRAFLDFVGGPGGQAVLAGF
jgi:phosphate transport system substrate-binding protein